MATSTGTTPTGTDVQNVDKAHTAMLYAEDSKLIGAVTAAATAANNSAGKLITDMGKLAGAIKDLHEAGTWARTIDGTTGKLYSSPKAFYSTLAQAGTFPLLHKVLRTELVELLMDGEKLAGIGTNELAAIIGCDAAQITRTVKSITSKAGEPVVPTDAELDAIAEAARVAALESGADDKAATYAAEQARAEAKAAAEVPAPELSAEDKAKADAQAEADELKRADKAGRTFVNATAAANDTFHLMTPERRAEVLKVAQELVSSIQSFEVGLAKVTPPKRTNAPKPGAATRKSA